MTSRNAPTALVDFTSSSSEAPGFRAAFGAPREVLAAHRPEEVRAVLEAAAAHAEAGAWCVGHVRYEAARAFDPAFEVRDADGPLAWFAVHDRVLPWPEAAAVPLYAPMQWQPGLDRPDFERRIERIHAAIADGEVYQINLTAPVSSAFMGDPLALFGALHAAQPGSYAAFIDTGDEQLLSVSPELFFDWREGRLLGRPMKGTAARGATPEDDAAAEAALRASPKERAENLMIVDLIRNDMSRIAEPHSVRVPRLFDTRAWPTVWQMTSDVTARTRPGTRLPDVFGALFPCGSVVGAPKVRAMHWIHELERSPRGVYCGAVGVLQPGGAATFSVAIRTVSVRGGQASCGIGSGITSDATAAGEWAEWRSKQAFLERAAGRFDLLQTLRLEHGRLQHLDLHVGRLREAAAHFGFEWREAAVRAALADLEAAHTEGSWRTRVTVAFDGALNVAADQLPATLAPVRVKLAAGPFEQSGGEFVRFKTTRRAHYEAAHKAAVSSAPDAYDALLWNARGEITEFTRGNVAVLLGGRWVTPPLRCGLMPGVGRQARLLDGTLVEQVVRVEDLPRIEGLAFLNALRGWLPAELVG